MKESGSCSLDSAHSAEILNRSALLWSSDFAHASIDDENELSQTFEVFDKFQTSRVQAQLATIEVCAYMMATYLMSFALAAFVLYVSKLALTSFLPRRPPQQRHPGSSGEKSWDVTKVKTYPRDLHDVCEAIFLLRQVLVPDLIPEILDLAEYWTVTSAARASRRAEFTQSNAGRAYVVASLPEYLPAGSVRKIKFSTVSRDQGWSSFPADHGTYENSHTWFEVVVYEPDPYELAKVVSPRIEIVTNVHAGKEWKKHDVIWTHDSEDERIRDTLAKMKGGQRVAITAWAAYPQWKNHVSSASIDIYSPRIRRG